MIHDEFKSADIELIPIGENKFKTLCPFHDDENPSCVIDVDKSAFLCNSCGAKGNLIKLYARITGKSIPETQVLLGLGTDRPIKVDTVERYHRKIWDEEVMLQELKARAVSYDLIRKYRLGFTAGRITIPVKNANGEYVNIRKYLPGAKDVPKMMSSKGRGKIPMWYPISQFSYDKIVVCGGEMKAIVAASILNEHGYGCVTLTGGEGNVAPYHAAKLKGKEVWICMDIDEAGKKASMKWAKLAFQYAIQVNILHLPFDVPKGDINDFVAMGHDLLEALEDESRHFTGIEVETSTEPERLHEVQLVEAISAEYAQKRVALKVDVVAIGEAPYILPKTFDVNCTKDQDYCVRCPVFMKLEDEASYEVSPESQNLLNMVDQSDARQNAALADEVGIPPCCTMASYEVVDWYTCEDVRVSQTLEIQNITTDRSMQHAVVIDNSVELNESYDMVGKMHPHPLTQEATLVISNSKTSDDALSSYQPGDTDKLKIFQPDVWSLKCLEEKLDEIYSDLCANVTQIRQRQGLHLCVDLVMHSCLFFELDGKKQKGWTDILVIGDSSQGKSEVWKCLQEFYRLGDKTECKNATVAGLLGGLKHIGKKWYVAWGAIPNNDRRALCLEEVKGTGVETISKLTDMRSSGIAELPKIEKRKTFARTRLLWLSNPRSTRVMSSYNVGVDAISELIGSPEDVRRFDFCYLVTSADVDQSLIHDKTSAEHKHKADPCRSLILWAWTRRAEDVTFENESLIISESKRLNEKYTDRLPILDRGSTRYKIARLAIALAVRTFSSPDGESLVVRDCHVRYITQMLDKHYSSAPVGYHDMSLSVKLNETMADEPQVRNTINSLPHPKDFIQSLLYTDQFDMTDVCDWCGYDRSEAQEVISLLVRKRAVRRISRRYVKNPPFIELLKTMNGEPNARPDFIPETKPEF